jgi:hypothetical protein
MTYANTFPYPAPRPTQLTDVQETEMLAMLRFMRKVVEEAGPHYRYPHRGMGLSACKYVWEGKPDCIAGRVLHLMGISLDILAQFEGKWCVYMRADNREFPTVADHALPDIPILLTTLRVLTQAQQRQDLGEPWADVLVATERVIRDDYGVVLP